MAYVLNRQTNKAAQDDAKRGSSMVVPGGATPNQVNRQSTFTSPMDVMNANRGNQNLAVGNRLDEIGQKDNARNIEQDTDQLATIGKALDAPTRNYNTMTDKDLITDTGNFDYGDVSFKDPTSKIGNTFRNPNVTASAQSLLKPKGDNYSSGMGVLDAALANRSGLIGKTIGQDTQNKSALWGNRENSLYDLSQAARRYNTPENPLSIDAPSAAYRDNSGYNSYANQLLDYIGGSRQKEDQVNRFSETARREELAAAAKAAQAAQAANIERIAKSIGGGQPMMSSDSLTGNYTLDGGFNPLNTTVTPTKVLQKETVEPTVNNYKYPSAGNPATIGSGATSQKIDLAPTGKPEQVNKFGDYIASPAVALSNWLEGRQYPEPMYEGFAETFQEPTEQTKSTNYKQPTTGSFKGSSKKFNF